MYIIRCCWHIQIKKMCAIHGAVKKGSKNLAPSGCTIWAIQFYALKRCALTEITYHSSSSRFLFRSMVHGRLCWGSCWFLLVFFISLSLSHTVLWLCSAITARCRSSSPLLDPRDRTRKSDCYVCEFVRRAQ